MPRQKQLTDVERGKILGMKACGMSGAAISRSIGRSKTVVNNFLKDPSKYGKCKRTGRPSVLSRRQKSSVFRWACDKKMSSSEIVRDLSLSCTSRTVRNVLSSNLRAQFIKLRPQPALTKKHKLARLEFAKKYVSLGDKWKDVVFSDEKKFNFDGPDGFKMYWHDIKKIKPYYSKRQYGGGSVMIWGAFAANGKLPVMVINTKMNAFKYQDMLGDTLLPNAPLVTSGDWIFQQDNASIHVAHSTKDWFEANEARLLDWPSCSPDLNPMENLWGILVQFVYKDMRQYRRKSEIIIAIKNAWNNIKNETLLELSATMTNRLIKVIEKKVNLWDIDFIFSFKTHRPYIYFQEEVPSDF